MLNKEQMWEKQSPNWRLLQMRSSRRGQARRKRNTPEQKEGEPEIGEADANVRLEVEVALIESPNIWGGTK